MANHHTHNKFKSITCEKNLRTQPRHVEEYFETNRICAKSPVFSNSREVTGRFKLEPGTYIIIPSTYEPNHEGDYLLRIYAERMTPLVLVS